MLRNCADCGQIFAHPVNKLCPSCTKKQNEMFEKVKEFIRMHPNATIQEVVVETGVEFDKWNSSMRAPQNCPHRCGVPLPDLRSQAFFRPDMQSVPSRFAAQGEIGRTG